MSANNIAYERSSSEQEQRRQTKWKGHIKQKAKPRTYYKVLNDSHDKVRWKSESMIQ